MLKKLTSKFWFRKSKDLYFMSCHDILLECELIIFFLTSRSSLEEEYIETFTQLNCLDKDAKYSAEEEKKIWKLYDVLSDKIKPIDTDCLRASYPIKERLEDGNTKRHPSTISKVVTLYTSITFMSLIILLVFHNYWVVGVKIHDQTLIVLENKKNFYRQLLSSNQVKHVGEEFILNVNCKDDSCKEIKNIQQRWIDEDQRFDEHYRLLREWNTYWEKICLHLGLSDKLLKGARSKYEMYVYQEKMQNKKISEKEKRAIENNHRLEIAMSERYINIFSASFVLNILEKYILPLFYGYLGSSIFILRQLYIHFKEITFSLKIRSRYRLRLWTGTLSGLIITMLFKDNIGGISLFTLAFLTGYNVDILFSFMDKTINRFIDKTEKDEVPKK